MRDGRGIKVNVGDAVLDAKSGTEYEIVSVTPKELDGKPVVELMLGARFIFPAAPDGKEIGIGGFLKVPRLDEEERTNRVLQMAKGVR